MNSAGDSVWSLMYSGSGSGAIVPNPSLLTSFNAGVVDSNQYADFLEVSGPGKVLVSAVQMYDATPLSQSWSFRSFNSLDGSFYAIHESVNYIHSGLSISYDENFYYVAGQEAITLMDATAVVQKIAVRNGQAVW